LAHRLCRLEGQRAVPRPDLEQRHVLAQEARRNFIWLITSLRDISGVSLVTRRGWSGTSRNNGTGQSACGSAARAGRRAAALRASVPPRNGGAAAPGYARGWLAACCSCAFIRREGEGQLCVTRAARDRLFELWLTQWGA
jgi:hypothetical protein